MSCGIIIPAAGQGKRMGLGVNKQFINLDGKPILIHTLESFQRKSWINEIIVVANPKEVNIVTELIRSYDLRVTRVVPGGKERQESIENGLTFVESEFVMVHDGARPFINDYMIEELYENVRIYEAVVLGVPVKDTIKITNDSGIIQNTPDRKSLWAIQTPQAFRLSILKEAYSKASADNFLGTDDSSLVERIGKKVKVILGQYDNIKITTPEDLKFAEIIINSGVKKSV